MQNRNRSRLSLGLRSGARAARESSPREASDYHPAPSKAAASPSLIPSCLTGAWD
jgi:hypothetical protein